MQKLKKANLAGRGGACFPVWQKWEMVGNAEGIKKYVVCNASEGEPNVFKDKFILEKYPEALIDGIMIAVDFLRASEAVIYMNPDYFDLFAVKLEKIIGTKPITLFKKPHQAGYIGGEETSALNAIEGRRIEPRLRPPYPPTHGLWGFPTLVNNVETFYDVSLINAGRYEGKRFFTIAGDCLWEGVFELGENCTIEKILKETNNYPDFDFFVQVGGGASGEVLNSGQLIAPVSGAGSITVYSMEKHNPPELIKKWVGFFTANSCGQCTPCREGTYRLKEALASKKINWKLVGNLLYDLNQTSFCAMGCSVPIPITSYIKNVLSDKAINIKLDRMERKMICDCLK